MPRTQLTGKEVSDRSIFYEDIDLTTALTHPTLLNNDRLLLVDPVDGLIKTSTLTNLQTLLDSRYSQTSHNHSLASLSDTTITSPASGEILKWSGSAWINNTFTEAGIAPAIHTHAYDNYVAWTFRVNSETLVNINSVNSAGTYRGVRLLDGVGISMEGSSGLNNDTIVTISNSAPFPGFGSTGSTAAYGNHLHTGVYAPLMHDHSMAALSDVTISSITTGEILKWNGTAWINNTLAEAGIQAAGAMSLASLSDTTITSVASGEVLKWNGLKWINNTLAEAGIAAASHTHSYDNYGSWQIQAGGSSFNVTSANYVNFGSGIEGVSVSWDATYHKVIISGNTKYSVLSTAQSCGTTSTRVNGIALTLSTGTYELEAVLDVYVNSGDANGTKYNIGSSMSATFTGGISGTKNATTNCSYRIDTLGGMFGPFLTLSGISGQVIIKGIYVVTEAEEAIGINHQKVTAGTSYIRAKSYLRATKIS